MQRWYSLSLIFLCSPPRWKWKGFISPMVNRACPPEGLYHPHTRTGEMFTELGLLSQDGGETCGAPIIPVQDAPGFSCLECAYFNPNTRIWMHGHGFHFGCGPVCVSELVLCGKCVKLPVHWVSKGWNWCVLLFLVKVGDLRIIE